MSTKKNEIENETENGEVAEAEDDNWLMEALANLLPPDFDDIQVAQRNIDTLVPMSKVDPDNTDMLYVLGNSFLTMGRHEEAMDIFFRVLFLEPDRLDARVSLGAAFMETRREGGPPPRIESDVEFTRSTMQHLLGQLLRGAFHKH